MDKSPGIPCVAPRCWSGCMSKPTPPTYRTTNWRSYDAALKQRGSLRIWFDPATVWLAAPSCKRGRSATLPSTARQWFACKPREGPHAMPAPSFRPVAMAGHGWRTRLEHTPGAQSRNETLRATRHLGRTIWRRWSGYHRRSLIETNPFVVCTQTPAGQRMRCFKLLGERVMARDFDRQVAELQIRAAILNRLTALGTPQTQRVG